MITSSINPDKIQALIGRRNAGLSTFVYEIVTVYWPQPTGTINYTCLPLDIASNCTALQAQLTGPIETRFQVGKSAGAGSYFRDVTISSGIADTVVNLDFIDMPDGNNDRKVSELFLLHGEGVKCEIFYYFPDVDLLASIWWGHLQSPDSMDGITFKASAASGFRSILLNLPKRNFVPYCIAQYGPAVRTFLGNSLPIFSPCPYDRDIGGSNGLLDNNGNPFMSCPKLESSCKQRFGDIDTLPWLGVDIIAQPNGDVIHHGGNTVAVTTGNETNLKDPLRVIFGDRTVQSLFLLQFTVDTNVDHPERGSLTTVFAVCEGPIQNIDLVQVDGTYATATAGRLQIRLGTIQQSPTHFTTAILTKNYSSTAIIDAIIAGDYRTATYSNITGSAHVQGLADVKAYTADGAVASSNYTNGQNPAWALLRCLTDKTWGMGEDLDRVVLQDFVNLATYCNEFVVFTDSTGNTSSGTRFTFNAELSGRSAQDQIKDICMFRWITPPFPFEGKTRVMPLEAETLDDSIRFFKDFGEDRNIVWEGSPKRTTMTWKKLSSRNLPNQLTVTFDDADNFNVTRPILINDEPAQIAAGRAFGDSSLRVITKLYSALGATHVGEVTRSANYLIDRGEFDSGGLINPISISFKTHVTDCIGLHKYSIIKVRSTVLTEVFDTYGFEFFRIMDLKFKGGEAWITATAYDVDYMQQSEVGTVITRPIIISGGGGPGGGGGGGGGGGPRLPVFKTIIGFPLIGPDQFQFKVY